MDNSILNSLYLVWDSLFPFEFEEDEYVELTYDNKGDRRYFNAAHIKTFGELVNFVEKKSGKCNISICPNTRKPINGLNRRTGGDAILRQKSMLINVIDKTRKCILDQDEIRRMIDDVMKSMPRQVRKAIRWTAYTGRGGLICVVFDKVMNFNEISSVYKFMKEILQGIRYIDEHSFKPAQAFTLIGTVAVNQE